MKTRKYKEIIAYMLGYIAISNSQLAKDILTDNFSIPSLNDRGKMSKSGQNSKAVIWMADDLETIKKKVAKIPSLKKNWDIFVKLAWSLFSDEEKNEVAIMTTENLLKVL